MEGKSPQSQRTVTHTNAATMQSRFKLFFLDHKTLPASIRPQPARLYHQTTRENHNNTTVCKSTYYRRWRYKYSRGSGIVRRQWPNNPLRELKKERETKERKTEGEWEREKLHNMYFPVSIFKISNVRYGNRGWERWLWKSESLESTFIEVKRRKEGKAYHTSTYWASCIHTSFHV